MRSRSRSGPVDAAEVGRTRRAGQWSSDMPPRTSRSEESSSDGGWSQMSTRPGSDTCSTDGAVGSPTHRLSYARIADTCTHPATDKLPDIAGRLPPWQSRTETGGAFWGMTVGARLHTTYWGLLKQPDNQKPASIRGTIFEESTCFVRRQERMIMSRIFSSGEPGPQLTWTAMLLSLTSLLSLRAGEDRDHDNLLPTAVNECKGGHRGATGTIGPDDPGRKRNRARGCDGARRSCRSDGSHSGGGFSSGRRKG